MPEYVLRQSSPAVWLGNLVEQCAVSDADAAVIAGTRLRHLNSVALNVVEIEWTS